MLRRDFRQILIKSVRMQLSNFIERPLAFFAAYHAFPF